MPTIWSLLGLVLGYVGSGMVMVATDLGLLKTQQGKVV